MGRLNYILDAKPSIDDSEVATQTKRTEAPMRGEIEFRHLEFTYPTARDGAQGKGSGRTGDKPVLYDINLEIPAGSTLAIVGPTGSGKSTLAALVARLWEAPAGTLFIDGRPIREWPLAQLRRCIGFVPQDTYLFSEPVRENIAFGVDAASDEAVCKAAETASLDDEIAGFPMGYATLVGERGTDPLWRPEAANRLLGPRARARPANSDRSTMPFPGVDTDTEERILSGLKELMKHRTTLLISHRVSTVRSADQIIVLRDGRIVERGTHDQLLAQGGYYEELYQKQLLEEELERA